MRPGNATGRLLVGLAAALVAAAASLAGVLGPMEDATVDTRFGLRDTPPVTDIVVVGIDDRSIARLGEWPFARSRHARAVDRLRQAGARAIVYDVQFTEPSPRPADDLALYDAIGRAGGATLATSTSDDQGRTSVLGGDEMLAGIDSRAAAANFSTDRGNVIRHYPARIKRLESVAVVAARRATGRTLPASAFDGGDAWIDFRGGPGAFPTVSFADLVAGRVPRARLRGQGRRHRLDRPEPAGPAPDRDERRRDDGGPRGPGERDLDRHARQSAARRASRARVPGDRAAGARRAAAEPRRAAGAHDRGRAAPGVRSPR